MLQAMLVGRGALRARMTRQTRMLATASGGTPQSYIEKVVQKYAVDWDPSVRVKSGDYVSIQPQTVMTHDNTGPVISKFRSIGATQIRNPDQVVFTLDHDVQNKSDKNLEKYSRIEAFAREKGIDFYPAGRGIGHQVLVEEGYAFPQSLVVASDSHSNMYGGVGAVGTPIVRTDAAAIWATGKTWWQIPPMVKVELTGALRHGVTGKDVIVALCGYFNKDEVLNSAIEFVGNGVKELGVDDRLSISNMTTEWGALAGVFPVDDTTLAWYEQLLRRMDRLSFQVGSSPRPSDTHARLNWKRLEELEADRFAADPGAQYTKHLQFDLSTLSPHVSGPNSVKVSTPLSELEQQNIQINKAYLVSCVNSRASDIASAASVLRGRKVAPGVEFYLGAASSIAQREAEQSGDWDALIAAGAHPLPAGCGPCIGLGVGLLEDGEVGISATNRNYKGRMGSPNALAYLASPAVVAASAARGSICSPDNLESPTGPAHPSLRIVETPQASKPAASEAPAAPAAALDPMFPASFCGPVIFAPQDNLNTDALYPGKYTYQDDITPERQAEVVMENYDPGFASVVAEERKRFPADAPKDTRFGVVLVGGYNFGTGSSREQAATALKYAGVPVVLAGSFSDVFKRNAINNGLICLQCAELVEDLTKEYGRDGARGNGGKRPGELCVLLDGADLRLDSRTGVAELTYPDGRQARYTTVPAGIGRSIQEIYVAGGMESWVRARL
ncbi:homoaconitate hydratase [Malassezia vespertilionis]|uniref:homoaconitate hydratase n=1 Tax=Malassezia vespertilionis TaxID=2020962 RepID=UPI0024B0D2CA|nr:homoaconitate hydratase [Malassezia vespertilionis]WFD06130.1 homoaconitate hydratase [Malassezia vespertilionis]